jgi:hypothetical protein
LEAPQVPIGNIEKIPHIISQEKDFFPHDGASIEDISVCLLKISRKEEQNNCSKNPAVSYLKYFIPTVEGRLEERPSSWKPHRFPAA